jgi:hypothetical protein
MKDILQSNSVFPESVDEILSSPEYFLSGLSTEGRTFEFIKSSRDQLSKPSFIDGRVPLSENSKIYQIKIEQALDWYSHNSIKTQANNFIFHMGFCGSTLLARALDLPGKSFSYKEPQALIHVAELHLTSDPFFKDNQILILNFILGQYSTPWSKSEQNIIKPSNWVNTMLYDLVASSKSTKAIFLSIRPLDFIVAVFRGGESRVQYVLNFLKHMNSSTSEFNDIIKKIERERENTTLSLVKLTLVAHKMQETAFSICSAALSKQNQAQYSYDQLILDPLGALTESSQLFDLNLSEDSFRITTDNSFVNHSKVIHRKYDRLASEDVNKQVLNHYAKEFENGLDWYQTNLVD